MNGNTNKRGDVDMIVYISKGKYNLTRVMKEILRYLKSCQIEDGLRLLCDSSEQNYIYLIKVTGKSIWA